MKVILLLFLLLPAVCMCQKIKVNELDKFTKERRIELEPVQILSSDKSNVSLSFSSLGPGLHVQFSGYGWGATTIDPGEKAIFLFSNDSTVTVNSIGLQTYQIVLSSLQNTYKHTYFIKETDLRLLSEYNLVGIRKYGSNDYTEMTVSRDRAERVKKASALFLDELKKADVFKNIQEINLANISKHIGDSVRFCSKVYTTRYFQSSENQPTLLDVNNSYSGQSVNLVIWGRDRQNFGNAPENLYLNKDVCVSGVVQLHNNSPQIVISNKNQIRVTSPITVADAESFSGDSVTVHGKVVNANPGAGSQNSSTFLNLSSANSEESLAVVIDKSDPGNLNFNPETYYLNKHIAVTGKVEVNDGKPQIIVRNRNQITELPDQRAETTETSQKTTPDGRNTGSGANVSHSSTGNLQVKRASFPGGQTAFLSFIRENLVWPEDELSMGEKKVVIAKFQINPDGTASDIRVAQTAGKEFDKEVVRVLKKMPKWEPQIENGVPVAISVTQPVTFVRPETVNRR